MTTELSQFTGDLRITRYTDKRYLAFTIHRGENLLLRCGGFTNSDYRERAINTHLRRLQGLPPIVTKSKEISEETRAVLRGWVERSYPSDLAEAA